MLFDNNTITRFSQQGEQNFCNYRPCIIKRVALTIVSGTSLYTLSDDVANIRRITYKGTKLDPLPARSEREVFQRANQVGKPFWYIYNNLNQNQIKLFPCPNENVAAATTGLFSTEIPNRVIVEYFQAPDFDTAIMPFYIRRRFLKSYVLKMCFSIEGSGQNLGNAAYFDKKYQMLMAKYGQLLDDLHNKPRKLTLNNIPGQNYFPGQPILPIATFGTSVRTGD